MTQNKCVNDRHPFVKGNNLWQTLLKMKKKQYETECKLVLFTIMKSYASFRLVSKLMTLNDLQRCNERRRALSLH